MNLDDIQAIEQVFTKLAGSVRQLQNVLTRAATMAGGRVVLLDHLRSVPEPADPINSPEPPQDGLSLREILADTERRVIARALKQTDWNRTHAAQKLGISRRQLFDKIRQYGLEP